jgi:hypothetical protein
VPALADDLRGKLETSIINARTAAEMAARAALDMFAVTRSEALPSMTSEQRAMRNALRAKARQLGGGSETGGYQFLIEAVAYVQWHRMLFARFLAENNLLMHPEGVAVTLEECVELAQEEGESDAWRLAARYASQMLPGIFVETDPLAELRLTPEGYDQLENILADLPAEVFIADDALGWVYQFWQTQKKKEVNASGRKIGGADLPPVTQLFTEDYMVRFLLENSLGAWWAAHHLDSPLNQSFTYLRYRDDGSPAAGTFPGWPPTAAEVTVMDPCCGSGHFLVAAFEMLRQMRMEEEGLSAAAAGDAVLRDNLFGLEIDPRCTQIAAFALALVAWKTGGYRDLPVPNIACSGIAVTGQRENWRKLANGDSNLWAVMNRLYDLFTDAPTLGSLINPIEAVKDLPMFTQDYAQIEPLLNRALRKEKARDPAAEVFGDTAKGVAKAARLLAGKYTLVATNVPYLGRGGQDNILKDFCDAHYPLSKADLATTFVERCRGFTRQHGGYSVVSPQGWLFLAKYESLRRDFLEHQKLEHVCRLGTGAFKTITGQVVNVALLIFSNHPASFEHQMTGIDITSATDSSEKAVSLRTNPLQLVKQSTQLKNPSHKVVLHDMHSGAAINDIAITSEGLHTGDYPRFGRKFWEIAAISDGWSYQQAAPANVVPYAGREHILFWEDGSGQLIEFVQERLNSKTVSMWIKGGEVWGKKGIIISIMSKLKATLYTGEIFTHGGAVVVPKDSQHLAALWAFCQSEDFQQRIRQLDQKVSVAVATFGQISIDIEHWQQVAEEAGPLPEPYSNDPTQWLFAGDLTDSTEPLQVAVARLLGYRWPEQVEDGLDTLADADGIVCLSALAGDDAAAERLRRLLAVAYGDTWSTGKQDELLAAVGSAGKDLATWLRDDFFKQHCRLFHNRPFIWHIWDGRKDGFSALVNYHRFDMARLDKLIYTYLGTWINARRAEHAREEAGAEGRLVAALELKKQLEAIRTGEPPYDIYVRWKSLHEQPIGWEPDLNDGVRLNIRPFVQADILRSKFTINWKKDRGKNPDGSERHNDRHHTTAEKRAARATVEQEVS